MSIRDDTISVSSEYWLRSLTVHGDETEGLEGRLFLMSALAALWLRMTEYGYLADASIENGVRNQEDPDPLLTLTLTLSLFYRLGRVGLVVPTRSHKYLQPSSIPGSSSCQKAYLTLIFWP